MSEPTLSLSLRISPQIKDKLERLAQERRLSQSQVVRQVLEEHIEEEGEKKGAAASATN